MGRRSSVVLTRLLAVVGLAVPLTLIMVGLTAGSATAGSAVACGKYKGSIPLNTAKVSRCSDSANTGGSGVVVAGGNLTSGVWRIEWATGPANSSYAMVTVTPVAKPSRCPKGTAYEYLISGKVTDFTGTAISIPIGDTVSATVCVAKSGSYKEAPHTRFMI